MSRSRTASILTALSLGVLALAGCSDDGPPRPMPTQSSASTPPSASASTTASTPATSSPSPSVSGSASVSGTASVPTGFSLDQVASPTFPNLGGDLGSLGAVRVGRHTGYDRVVWQFAGSGRPTYQVHYVDPPTGQGSGDVVAVRGDAYLEVMVTTVGMPPAGTPRPAGASAASLAGTVIAEAKAVYGGVEGYGQTFVGIRGQQRPFQVSVLTNPTRLVVDVYSG